MERIRAELHKTATSTVVEVATSDSRAIQAAPLGDNARRRYRFSEFRSLEIESFVRNAYLLLLGREPDEMGRLTALHRLENGQTGRASLLRELLESPEGRQHGASMSGFGIHPMLDKVRYNRFTRVLPVAARLLRNSPRIVNHMRQLAAQAGTAERLALQALASAESAQRTAQSLVDAQRSNALQVLESRLLQQNASLKAMIEAYQREVNERLKGGEIEQRVSQLEDGLARAVSPEAVERLAFAQAEQQRKLADQWRAVADQKLRLEMLLAQVHRRMPQPLDPEQIAAIADEEAHLLDAFYVSFEDRYRGTRADIKNRQKVYLPDVAQAVAATNGAPVVDVGCGRGEWLELLQENGFVAQGYDLNRVMVQESRDRGVDVTLGDALEALAAMPENSRAAITGFHIIEHLPFAAVVRLFDQALRVLRPGGLVIFETPNPGNLLVASERFYMDPTHRNPLPADLMTFVAEMRGFTSVESRFLHPPAEQVPQTPDPLSSLLHARIYAPQDYAVIGWKA
jgi:SAM-dependent methyltransferase